MKLLKEQNKMKQRIKDLDSRVIGKKVKVSDLKAGYIIRFRGVPVNVIQIFLPSDNEKAAASVMVRTANVGLLRTMGYNPDDNRIFTLKMDCKSAYYVVGFNRPQPGGKYRLCESCPGWAIKVRGVRFNVKNVLPGYVACYAVDEEEAEKAGFKRYLEGTSKYVLDWWNELEDIEYIGRWAAYVRELNRGTEFIYRDNVYRKGAYVRGVVPVFVCEKVGKGVLQNFAPDLLVELKDKEI